MLGSMAFHGSRAMCLLLCVVGCDGATPPIDAGPLPVECVDGPIPALTATPIAGGPFSSPIYVTQAPGRADALFVVERGGRIQIVIDGAVSTFLDLSGTVVAGGEQGLLGLAFDPDYASSGRFFVYYTPRAAAQNVVAEYRRSSDPNVAEPAEVARLWEVDDPEGNHNGGPLQFGPDGFLYAATGDGGGANDDHGEFGNALDPNNTLGKILRFDIDAAASDYAAAGNPFIGGGGSPLVWATGLRNPWRFSFDRETGDLYLGDVGQNLYEEIDFLPRNAPGGANFGWRAYEGDAVFRPNEQSRVPDHAAPIFVVDRVTDPFLRSPCAIVGGYVYRGSAIPALEGVYLFGDNCSRDVGAFHYCADDDSVRDATRVDGLEGLGANLSSFGEDLAGELYLVYLTSGEVMRIQAQ
jgi:glucose/arabinose dehydrogenase